MSEHTPGPWHWVNSRNDEPWELGAYGTPSLRTVATFGQNKTEIIDGKSYTSFALPMCILYAEDPLENAADLSLIAAAPDLLESLKRVLLDIEFMWEDGTLPNRRDDIIYQAARAAIAKATGEP